MTRLVSVVPARGDQYFNGDEAQKLLQRAILTLPDKQRLVFQMKYFDEMKYEEMSEILSTSVGALKASYHHAVKRLKIFNRLHLNFIRGVSLFNVVQRKKHGMEKGMNKLSEIDKSNPFTVPEDYFSRLNEQIMNCLPEKEAIEPQKVTMWDRVKPWIYMAAMFLGFFFAIHLTKETGNHAGAGQTL